MKEKIYDVAALGELLIDFTPNGLSENGNIIYEANPGGAPCNVLSMLGKLGNSTVFIGKVGKDSFGELLKEAISECGISTKALYMDEKVPTTLAFVHKKPNGDRDFSFYRNPGADMMLTKEEIPLDIIESSRLFHYGTLSMTGNECEMATRKAVETARSTGLIISFDPNIRLPLWDSKDRAREKMAYGLSNCDILKISDDEIYFFTGKKDVDEGIRLIRDKYNIPLICATLGKDGSIAYYNDQRVFCPSKANPEAIETTGAGDTFMGCVIDFCLKHDLFSLTGDDLFLMLKRANTAASIITTRRGALRVMPDAEEIQKNMNV